jgi:cytoskeletal protein CcmA (bactofilin family)
MAFMRKPDPMPVEVVPPALNPEQQRASTAPDGPRAFASPSEAGSIIGSDLSIEGQSITIRCKGSLHLNGNIQADLHCVELLVGEPAVVAGSIVAEKVAVFGRVNGAIFGDSVVLHSTAHVEGDISSRSLVVEEGARFDGRSRKVTDRAEVAPQLETSPTVTG